MKKVSIITGLLTCFLGASSVSAYEEQILFRNVPWGSSIKESMKLLPELGLYPLDLDVIRPTTLHGLCDFMEENEALKNAGKEIGTEAVSYAKIDVAGYEPTEIRLIYATVPEEGKMPDDYLESSALYAAEYSFEPKSLEAMQEDLLKKLTDLYGEPTTVDSSQSTMKVMHTEYYWEGAEGSFLSMSCGDTSKVTAIRMNDYLNLKYGWAKGDELLLEAMECMTDGNTNGL